MKKKKYLIANWKCNFQPEMIVPYFSALNQIKPSNIDIQIAVPSIYLREAQALSHYPIIAQDVESFTYGAHTGRLSYQHLLDNHIKGCLIGHSEQRVFNDNTNEIINEKLKQALVHGLQVILCVGEALSIYQNHQTTDFIEEQISSALKDIDYDQYKEQLIIAYEPIWAIGTGNIPTNEIIHNIVSFIKTKFPFPVIYGGSVNASNFKELQTIPSIDGFLVGGASLDYHSFIELINLYTNK